MSSYLLTRTGGLFTDGTSAEFPQAEAYFRATFENAAVGIAHVAPDGSWLRVNRRLCEIVGYARDELLAKTFQDITHPDDLEADLAQLRRMRDSGIDTYNREKRYLRKDGSTVWVRLTVGCVRNEYSGVAYFIAVVEDISEQKRAGIALRESEEKFRGIFDHAATGIAITDLKGRFQSCNRAYSNMLGYTEDELRALDFPRLVHPEDREANMVEISRLIAQQIPALEIVNRSVAKDGRPLWVHKHASLLKDAAGEPTGMIALVTDMTERKRYEERLRESEERLRLALDAADLGIWHWEAAKGAGAMDADARCKALFGQPPGAPATYEIWVNAIVPEDRAETEACFARALDPASPDDDYACEYRIKHADGTMRWLSAKGRAYFEPDPASLSGRRALSMAGTIRDVTEAHMADQLRRELERRNRYLLELEKRLQHAATAGEAVRVACEALGEELGATFVLGGELMPDSGGIATESAWSARGDAAPLLGLRGVADLGGKHIAALLAGETVCVADVAVEAPATAGNALFAARGVRSLIGVPLARDGKPSAFLFAADAVPRNWTGAEAEIAHDTVNRLWQAIEKARANVLRESEERLRHLGDSLPDSAVFRYTLNSDGRPRFLYMSAGIEQLNGVRAGDVLRDAGVLFRQIPPEYLPRIADAEQRSARDFSDFKMEVPMQRPDGKLRWIRVQARPRRQDGRVVWEGVQTDVTDRVEAERALRASEERFRGIYEHAGIGIVILDPKGRFETCNPAYSTMLGYTEKELRGLSFSDLVHEEDREANAEHARRLCAQEIPSFEILNRFVRKDGLPVWVHKHVSQLRDPAGRSACYIVLVTDRTGVKRHEEQIDLLVREVNHRSKNILTVVQSIARQTAAAKPEEFVERFAERIRALAASQDLLVKNEWKGVDLNELVRSQLSHFKDLIGKRIELRGPSLVTSAPAAQTIGMALHELATNAGKYGALSGGDGGVEIDWSLEPGEDGRETFVINWRERGGPAVTAPAKAGFGSTVLCQVAKESLDAQVELNYASAGLTWRLECPAGEVMETARSA